MTEPLGPTGPVESDPLPEPMSGLEPTTEAVPTTVVEVQPLISAANARIGSPRRRRLRWAIAAVATAVVVVGTTLGFAVLSSARSSSQVLPWAPGDSILYTEVRADMPGDQRANLLAFLSKFPGFADQTSFDVKADDGLDRLVKKLTDNKHDFSTEIKPWFGGQLGISVEGADINAPGVLLVASVRDTAGAAAWLKAIAPTDATHLTVGGVDLTEVGGSSPKTAGAWGLDGSILLAGTVDAVKAAITRGPSGDLAGNAGFKAAASALNGDDLASMYVDMKSYFKLVTDAEAQMLSQLGNEGGGMTMPSMAPLDTSLLPGWVAMRVRAESDHLVFDEALQTVAGQSAQAGHTSTIAAELPASTVAQYELHDVGSQVKNVIGQIEGQPGAPTAAQVDAALKYVGGLDKAVGWLGDADIVVLHDSAGFSGGVVAQTTDAAASTDLIAELKNLASLAGSQVGVTLRTESYDGQTITIVGADLSSAGMGTSGRLDLAFTQTKDLVIAGVGDGFVKAVLDTKAGSSLADQPAYQRAIGLTGASNAGQGFVDLTAVRTAIEALAAGSDGMKAYASDVKPFLEPIQSIAWSTTMGTDVSTGRFVLVLK